MPAFFFFFVSSCYSDFRLKLYDILHLTPFVLALLFNFMSAQGFAPQTVVNIVTSGSAISILLTHMIYYGYMAAIIIILWRFNKQFRRHYSGGRSEVLVWLTQLAGVSLFAHTLIMLRDVLRFTWASEIVLVLQIFGAVLALAIATWIAIKSLMQPYLFRDVDRRLLRLGLDRSTINDSVLNKALEYVESEKPYLDPDITLSKLSYQLAMTPRELSELINGAVGIHFFDFVNSYRVRHAKELLLSNPNISVLNVLYESGFNSKSSFNTAFKKHAGLTPSMLRAQAR